MSFFHGLQMGTRLFLVSGFSTSHSGDNPNIVMANTSGYIYVLLDPKADALKKASVPTAASTATPTATPSPSGSATPTPTQSPTPTTKP